MERLKFKIEITESAEKVWKILWEAETYGQWTKVFSEGSYAISDWEEGSKIMFVSESGEGVYSEIAKKIPNDFMSFKHLGMIKDGHEVPAAIEHEDWSGSFENYKLIQNGKATELEVEMDVAPEYKDYFLETFPKALAMIKKMSESTN